MPEILKIRIKRGNKGYGFVLSNQAPCVVSNVTDGGPADVALLKNGDEILEVNDENVSRSTHEHVVRLLLKSSTKLVDLLICRHSDEFDSTEDLPTEMDGKEDLHKTITETVDKVVQDLKVPLRLGKFFKDEKELPKKKRQSFPQQTSIDKNDFERQLCSSFHIPMDSFNLNSGSKSLEDPGILERNFQFFVGYLQTTELPDCRNLPLASKNLLNNCVKGLHVKSKKINKHFLMHISRSGISLSSSNSHNIIIYPLKTISYTCCCPDDERFFGIVTRKESSSENTSLPIAHTMTSSNRHQPDKCSCHIFMVDSELCSHTRHQSISELFAIKCQPDPHFHTCQEFPLSSSTVLSKLSSMYSEVEHNDINTSEPLHALSQIELDDNALGYERKLSEMLQIRDKRSSLGSPGKSHTEVRNFTRSPFKQRKPLPFYDENRCSIESQGKSEEGISLEKQTAFGKSGDILSSIEGPCDEGPNKESVPCDDIMDGNRNDKKKDADCEQSLEALLKNPFGLRCFEAFLKKEHSEENIMFWKAIETYRTINDPVKLRKMAIDIYHTYLAGGAPGLVNVDQKAVKKAEEKLINPDACMFDLPQEQIFMLMKYDCFPRYVKSEFSRRIPPADDFDNESENKERKRKTQWYLKKKTGSKETGVKGRTENEVNDQYDKKKTLLSLWSKGKGLKQDPKPHDKFAKLLKSKGHSGSQSSLSDSGSRPTSPSVKEDRKKFEIPKSPSEIKELLGCEMPFCQVILPNGSSNVIMLESGKLIREILQTCCSRQNLIFSAHEVRVEDEKKQPVDLNKDSLFFADDVIYLERKVQFRFDLPNKRSVAVMQSSSAILFDVLEPIMRKNGYNIEKFSILRNKSRDMVSLNSTVASVENKHLIAELKAAFQGDVTWRPPTATGLPSKEKASFFRKQRQGSKDDCSLPSTSKLMKHSMKSEEELNKFVRRGSFEGHRSYFARIKQGIKGTKTTRSKSIDHTKYGLKAPKAKSKNSSNELAVSGTPIHQRQNSAPSFSKLDDDNDTVSWGSHQDINETFHPASEVFYTNNDDEKHVDTQFDRRASMPSKFFESISQGRNQTDNSSSEYSLPTPKWTMFGNTTRKSDPNPNSAMSDPELAVRRGRTQNVKAIPDEIKRAKSASEAQRHLLRDKKSDEKYKNRKKLPRNLETWRARENSCDSGSSSPGDEREPSSLKKFKREDTKRHSSPGFPRTSPGSPQNKQKKLSMQDTEIEIAYSPIYLDDLKKQNRPKVRPLPITVANESDILRGLDLESNEKMPTPDIVIDRVADQEIDDSFEGAIEQFSKRKENEENVDPLVSTLKQEEQEKTCKEKGRNCDSSLEEVAKQETLSNDSHCSHPSLESEYNITVTGSMNDETLIMEDKDTGLDLSGLMDMRNMKKNKKIVKQREEKEPNRKETTITFV